MFLRSDVWFPCRTLKQKAGSGVRLTNLVSDPRSQRPAFVGNYAPPPPLGCKGEIDMSNGPAFWMVVLVTGFALLVGVIVCVVAITYGFIRSRKRIPLGNKDKQADRDFH